MRLLVCKIGVAKARFNSLLKKKFDTHDLMLAPVV
jgi:hypothetical protein